jgi:diguanylate cyclase (GGDEF)-like protein
MKKSVIVISAANADVSSDLIEILRAAGMAVLPGAVDFHAPGHSKNRSDESVLIAIVCDLESPQASDLRRVAQQVRSAWPGIPLVACWSSAIPPKQASRQLVIRAGFDALADSAAQLPALLREVEDGREPITYPERFKAPDETAFTLTEALRKDELRGAFALLASLHRALSQSEAAAAALSGLGRLIKADRWSIFIIQDNTAAVRLAPLTTRAFTSGEALSFDDRWQSELLEDVSVSDEVPSKAALEAVANVTAIKRSEKGRRVLVAPLVSGERIVGCIEGTRDSTTGSFTRADLRVLNAVASSIASALSNSVRIADAERLSLIDDLTRLHNARYLRQFLVNEIKRARRYHTRVSALFLDLDDFKRVNDMHGHLAGSHVLMEVAGLVLPSVRDTDCVVRYGGDEFVVILPEAGPEDATIVAERIRRRIGAHRFTGGRRLRISLTVSIGVAVFPDNSLSPHQLVSCADQAMYAAKATNKNCVRLAEHSVTAPNDESEASSNALGQQFQRIPDQRFIS